MMKLKSFGLVLAVGALAACQDLDVVNPNTPALDESVSTPTNLETTVQSAFKYWHGQTMDDDARQGVSGWTTHALAGNADEITTMNGQFFFDAVAQEPKQAVDHSDAGFWWNRTPWANFHTAIAMCNRVIEALDAGMKLGVIDEQFPNGRNTDRARWFCDFVAGASHAYIASMYDRGFILEPGVERDIYSTDFKTPAEVNAYAIQRIEQAIAFAKTAQNDETAPNWVQGQIYTRDEFIQVMYSYLARIRAFNARNTVERAAVDWAKVISDVDNGIQDNFHPVAGSLMAGRSALCPTSGVVCSGSFLWVANNSVSGTRAYYRLWTHTTANTNARVAQRFLGPGDISGAWAWWESQPLGSRKDTIYTSTDKRIHLTTNSSAGRYFARGTAPPAAHFGVQTFSRYIMQRFGPFGQNGYRDSVNTSLTRTEMDLLKAEALIRTGQAALAVPLINKTRVGVRCIANVPGPVVSNAGTFVVGQQYSIVSVGTTNFTLIGASANTVGVVFTATGAGSGTGTAALTVPCTSVASPVATNENGTYGGNLPAVTAAGVPVAADCVPHRLDGTCGDLMDALMWEKRLESMSIDPIINWSDWRAWGKFRNGTWLHMPIHSRELFTLGIPYYTFGGSTPGTVGQPGVVYAQVPY